MATLILPFCTLARHSSHSTHQLPASNCHHLSHHFSHSHSHLLPLTQHMLIISSSLPIQHHHSLSNSSHRVISSSPIQHSHQSLLPAFCHSAQQGSISPTGNLFSSNTLKISSPTAPVAPTTAIIVIYSKLLSLFHQHTIFMLHSQPNGSSQTYAFLSAQTQRLSISLLKISTSLVLLITFSKLCKLP